MSTRYTKVIHDKAENMILDYNKEIYKQIQALYHKLGDEINLCIKAGEPVDAMAERIFTSTRELIKNEMDVISKVSSEDCRLLSNLFPFQSNKVGLTLESAYELLNVYFVKQIINYAVSGELYTNPDELNLTGLNNVKLGDGALYRLEQPEANTFQTTLLFMLAELTKSHTLQQLRSKIGFNVDTQDYYNPKVGPNTYELDIPKSCCNQVTEDSMLVVKIEEGVCKMYVNGLGYSYGGSRFSSQTTKYPPQDCSSFVDVVIGLKYPATTTHMWNSYHNNCDKNDKWCSQVSQYLGALEEVKTLDDVLNKIEPGDVYLRKTKDSGHVSFVDNVYKCSENGVDGVCIDTLQFSRDVTLTNGAAHKYFIGIDGAGKLTYFMQEKDMTECEVNGNWCEIKFLRPIEQQLVEQHDL